MAGYKVLGSLFKSVPQTQELRLPLDADSGLFYELESGYAIFKSRVKAGPVQKGARLPLNCMLEAYELLRDGVRVGFFFVSQFQISNCGGYLVTWMTNGAGRANSVEVMLKTEDLVVLNYPNRGTLVISPKVNAPILSVFEEQ
jgi:hypothetical protein